MSEIGVGSVVWIRRDWRSDWREDTITGETRVSWIIGENSWEQVKFPKKADACGRRWIKGRNGGGERVAISREELEGLKYISDYRAIIERRVGFCEDAEVLRQIAALVGFVPEERAK